jgi:Holliday junction resolvase-like predicted endonuclease
MREVMTEAEIHRLGVQIVRDELQSEGWTILDINVNPKVNPQIIARKNGTLGHVLVRTARHPKKGAVEDPTPWIGAWRTPQRSMRSASSRACA